MIALGLRSLYAAGVRWPLPNWRGGNVCPTATGTPPTPHDWARYCCRRCGLLTDEAHRTLPPWNS